MRVLCGCIGEMAECKFINIGSGDFKIWECTHCGKTILTVDA